MAADLSIHVLVGADDHDVSEFFRNTLGSRYFNGFGLGRRDEGAWDRIANTPQVWVGEVSWLKSALFDDGDDYIPGHVQAVTDAIGEGLPIIDDALIAKIDAAFAQPNRSIYHDDGFEQTHASALAFLNEHRGQRCFTVSW